MGLWVLQYPGSPPSSWSFLVRYDLAFLLLSFAAAGVAAGAALLLASRSKPDVFSWLSGSLFIGGALAGMQGSSIGSLRIPGVLVRYESSRMLPALLLMLVAALLIVRLAFLLKSQAAGWNRRRLLYAAVSSLLLYGVHLLWMSSLRMVPSAGTPADPGSVAAPAPVVAAALALVMVLALALVLVALVMDGCASRQTLEMQLNEERHRMAIALAAQRVSRLENEALVKEIQERRKIEAALNHAAFHDDLTGLANRVCFMDRLSLVLRETKSHGHFAVLYIDLDNFKAVNDVLGHRAGDAVLQEVGARLARCIREEDTLARMGGDEFTLLFTRFQHTDQAFRMAQRMLDVIEEPLILFGMRIPLSASVGLCEVDDSYASAEEILRNADTAMYNAKRQGGARCVLYETSMYEEALTALQEKLQLKAAIENEEFVLYYQPIVHLRDASIYGVEALVRWNHPLRGLLAPGAFIGLAEESGHIVPLGSWILRQSCCEFRRLQQASARNLVLSVNVSTRQMEKEDFLRELRQVIEDSGIDPRYLQLEITESIFLKDTVRIGALLSEVRALGVRIALDDFGTGYSSLGYLEKYPIDTLKIDQTFVRRMRANTVNADIVQLTIKLAQAIGIGVSAEGVEEHLQAFDLLEYGCDIAQGFLYSRPVALESTLALLSLGHARPAPDQNQPSSLRIN